jgi:hypothetical protein
MARISVDLPEPEAPIRATISPLAMVKPISASTGRPAWNDLPMPMTSMAASSTSVVPGKLQNPVRPSCYAVN